MPEGGQAVSFSEQERARMRAAKRASEEVANAVYRTLRSNGLHKRLNRVEYRCPTKDRCLLLVAYEIPGQGVLLHQNRFKFTLPVNLSASNDAGRESNTYDGNNHWRERTYWLSQCALDIPSGSLDVQCDHLRSRLSGADFLQDWGKRRRRPTIIMAAQDHPA